MHLCDPVVAMIAYHVCRFSHGVRDHYIRVAQGVSPPDELTAEVERDEQCAESNPRGDVGLYKGLRPLRAFHPDHVPLPSPMLFRSMRVDFQQRLRPARPAALSRLRKFRSCGRSSWEQKPLSG